MGAPIEIGRDEARRLAAEELAKAKYQGQPAWLEDLLERLGEFLDNLMNPWIGPQPGDPGVPDWIFAVVIGLVVVGLGLIVWKVGIPRWRPTVRDAEVETDPEASPQDYRTAAQRAADEGRWTDAVRERFRALVRELEHRTIIDPRPGRTALEAAGSAARMMPTVHDELRAAALLFNDVMYGELAADRDAYDRLSRAEDAIREAAERYRHVDVEEADAGMAEVPR